jgi:DNA polymerase I-like protein with 3'-5' exonuclease and polymerase domains
LSYDPVTGTQVLEYKTETARHLLDRYSVDKMYELPFEAVAEKCCLDALVTLEYFLLNKPKINQNHYERRRRFTVMLLKMSHRGLKLNQTLVQDLALQLESDIARFKGITDAIGFNPNSTEQVSYMLSTQGVIIPLNRNHKPTTDAKILSQIDHPWAALTLASRRVNKLYSTYVKKWKGLARAYSHFRQDATTTRTKSSDDNLQNIPTGKGASDWKPAAGRIRNVFVPDDEGPYDPVLQAPVWTRWDLSQVELRTFAQLVERDMGKSDMKWYLDFKLNNPDTPAHRVPDLHTETQEFFHLPNRLLAKRGNFGMIFGGSDEVLAEHMELDDPRKVAEFKRGWENRWPVEAAWIQMQREKGLRELKAYTLKGQEMDLTNTTKMLTDKHVMNSAIAWPVQGSAAELFQEINIEIVDGIGVPEELIALHVHDEGLINGYFDLPWDALSHLTDLWTPFEHSYLTAWE